MFPAAVPFAAGAAARFGLALSAGAAAGALALGAGLSARTVRRVLHPPRRLLLRSPADVGLPFEPVSFPARDGVRLAGWFVPGPAPAAVALAHGAWMNRQGVLEIAAALWRLGGLSLLLFDLRACGESGGDTVTFGYREQADLLGAVDYLRTRPEADPDRIGVFGSSMGAATALLAAAASREVAAVAADSAFTSLEALIACSFRAFTGLPPFPFAPLVAALAERRTGLRAADIAPLAVVERVSPTPLLLIHGAEDRLIPAADAAALYAAAGEPKELWVIEGAGHTQGHAVAGELFEQRLAGFFCRWLLDGSGPAPDHAALLTALQ